MIKKIPDSLRDDMASDSFYSDCCIKDDNCNGRIEWHHNLIFAGSRVNSKFSILPVCNWHHTREKLTEIKERLDWVMLNRMTKEDEELYLGDAWVQRKKYLASKFASES